METKKRGSKKFTKGQKILAAFVVFCLVLSDVAQAVSYLPTQSAPVVAPEAVRTSNEIPADLGKIQETYNGTSGKTIIFIQDAHDSLEAQKNIAGLIEHLVEHQSIRTVFEEGYQGAVPTDEYFKELQNPETKQKVSYLLLDALRLGGAEYAHINRKKDFNLVGVDDADLHLATINWYRVMAKSQEETAKELAEIETLLKNLIPGNLPKPLQEAIALKEKVDHRQASFVDYLKTIYGDLSEILPVEGLHTRYPVIHSIVSALDQKESAQLNERMQRIDTKMMFQELQILESSLADVYAENEEQKELFHDYRMVQLIKRLNQLEITPHEFEAIKNSLHSISTEKIAKFTAKKSKRTVILSKKWEENIQSGILFYEAAYSRDKKVEENLKQFIASEDNTAVLVFGGFHSDRIKEILKTNHLSYQVVAPRITEMSPRHRKYYKHLMAGGLHAFEMAENLGKSSRPLSDLRIYNASEAHRLLAEIARILETSQGDMTPELVARRMIESKQGMDPVAQSRIQVNETPDYLNASVTTQAENLETDNRKNNAIYRWLAAVKSKIQSFFNVKTAVRALSTGAVVAFACACPSSQDLGPVSTLPGNPQTNVFHTGLSTGEIENLGNDTYKLKFSLIGAGTNGFVSLVFEFPETIDLTGEIGTQLMTQIATSGFDYMKVAFTDSEEAGDDTSHLFISGLLPYPKETAIPLYLASVENPDFDPSRTKRISFVVDEQQTRGILLGNFTVRLKGVDHDATQYPAANQTLEPTEWPRQQDGIRPQAAANVSLSEEAGEEGLPTAVARLSPLDAETSILDADFYREDSFVFILVNYDNGSTDAIETLDMNERPFNGVINFGARLVEGNPDSVKIELVGIDEESGEPISAKDEVSLEGLTDQMQIYSIRVEDILNQVSHPRLTADKVTGFVISVAEPNDGAEPGVVKMEFKLPGVEVIPVVGGDETLISTRSEARHSKTKQKKKKVVEAQEPTVQKFTSRNDALTKFLTAGGKLLSALATLLKGLGDFLSSASKLIGRAWAIYLSLSAILSSAIVQTVSASAALDSHQTSVAAATATVILQILSISSNSRSEAREEKTPIITRLSFLTVMAASVAGLFSQPVKAEERAMPEVIVSPKQENAKGTTLTMIPANPREPIVYHTGTSTGVATHLGNNIFELDYNLQGAGQNGFVAMVLEFKTSVNWVQEIGNFTFNIAADGTSQVRMGFNDTDNDSSHVRVSQITSALQETIVPASYVDIQNPNYDPERTKRVLFIVDPGLTGGVLRGKVRVQMLGIDINPPQSPVQGSPALTVWPKLADGGPALASVNVSLNAGGNPTAEANLIPIDQTTFRYSHRGFQDDSFSFLFANWDNGTTSETEFIPDLAGAPFNGNITFAARLISGTPDSVKLELIGKTASGIEVKDEVPIVGLTNQMRTYSIPVPDITNQFSEPNLKADNVFALVLSVAAGSDQAELEFTMPGIQVIPIVRPEPNLSSMTVPFFEERTPSRPRSEMRKEKEEPRSPRLSSRRQFLKSLAIGAAACAAGCPGSIGRPNPTTETIPLSDNYEIRLVRAGETIQRPGSNVQEVYLIDRNTGIEERIAITDHPDLYSITPDETYVTHAFYVPDGAQTPFLSSITGGPLRSGFKFYNTQTKTAGSVEITEGQIIEVRYNDYIAELEVLRDDGIPTKIYVDMEAGVMVTPSNVSYGIQERLEQSQLSRTVYYDIFLVESNEIVTSFIKDQSFSIATSGLSIASADLPDASPDGNYLIHAFTERCTVSSSGCAAIQALEVRDAMTGQTLHRIDLANLSFGDLAITNARFEPGLNHIIKVTYEDGMSERYDAATGALIEEAILEISPSETLTIANITPLPTENMNIIGIAGGYGSSTQRGILANLSISDPNDNLAGSGFSVRNGSLNLLQLLNGGSYVFGIDLVTGQIQPDVSQLVLEIGDINGNKKSIDLINRTIGEDVFEVTPEQLDRVFTEQGVDLTQVKTVFINLWREAGTSFTGPINEQINFNVIPGEVAALEISPSANLTSADITPLPIEQMTPRRVAESGNTSTTVGSSPRGVLANLEFTTPFNYGGAGFERWTATSIDLLSVLNGGSFVFGIDLVGGQIQPDVSQMVLEIGDVNGNKKSIDLINRTTGEDIFEVTPEQLDFVFTQKGVDLTQVKTIFLVLWRESGTGFIGTVREQINFNVIPTENNAVGSSWTQYDAEPRSEARELVKIPSRRRLLMQLGALVAVGSAIPEIVRALPAIVVAPSTELSVEHIVGSPELGFGLPQYGSIAPLGADASVTGTKRGFELTYDTSSVGFAGGSMSYNNFETPSVEVRDFSNIQELRFGIQSEVSHVSAQRLKFEIATYQAGFERKQSIPLEGIDGVERVWAIPMSYFTNLNLTKVTAVNFIVEGQNLRGKLKINRRSLVTVDSGLDTSELTMLPEYRQTIGTPTERGMRISYQNPGNGFSYGGFQYYTSAGPADMSQLPELRFGVRGTQPEIKLEMSDAYNQKRWVSIRGIRPDVEQVVTIPTQLLTSLPDMNFTKIRYLYFVVEEIAGQTGFLEVNHVPTPRNAVGSSWRLYEQGESQPRSESRLITVPTIAKKPSLRQVLSRYAAYVVGILSLISSLVRYAAADNKEDDRAPIINTAAAEKTDAQTKALAGAVESTVLPANPREPIVYRTGTSTGTVTHLGNNLFELDYNLQGAGQNGFVAMVVDFPRVVNLPQEIGDFAFNIAANGTNQIRIGFNDTDNDASHVRVQQISPSLQQAVVPANIVDVQNPDYDPEQTQRILFIVDTGLTGGVLQGKLKVQMLGIDVNPAQSPVQGNPALTAWPRLADGSPVLASANVSVRDGLPTAQANLIPLDQTTFRYIHRGLESGSFSFLFANWDNGTTSETEFIPNLNGEPFNGNITFGARLVSGTPDSVKIELIGKTASGVEVKDEVSITGLTSEYQIYSVPVSQITNQFSDPRLKSDNVFAAVISIASANRQVELEFTMPGIQVIPIVTPIPLSTGSSWKLYEQEPAPRSETREPQASLITIARRTAQQYLDILLARFSAQPVVVQEKVSAETASTRRVFMNTMGKAALAAIGLCGATGCPREPQQPELPGVVSLKSPTDLPSFLPDYPQVASIGSNFKVITELTHDESDTSLVRLGYRLTNDRHFAGVTAAWGQDRPVSLQNLNTFTFHIRSDNEGPTEVRGEFLDASEPVAKKAPFRIIGTNSNLGQGDLDMDLMRATYPNFDWRQVTQVNFIVSPNLAPNDRTGSIEVYLNGLDLDRRFAPDSTLSDEDITLMPRLADGSLPQWAAFSTTRPGEDPEEEIPTARTKVIALDNDTFVILAEGIEDFSAGGAFASFKNFSNDDDLGIVNLQQMYPGGMVVSAQGIAWEDEGKSYLPADEVEWSIEEAVREEGDKTRSDNVFLTSLTEEPAHYRVPVSDFANARANPARATTTAFSVKVNAGERKAILVKWGKHGFTKPVIYGSNEEHSVLENFPGLFRLESQPGVVSQILPAEREFQITYDLTLPIEEPRKNFGGVAVAWRTDEPANLETMLPDGNLSFRVRTGNTGATGIKMELLDNSGHAVSQDFNDITAEDGLAKISLEELAGVNPDFDFTQVTQINFLVDERLVPDDLIGDITVAIDGFNFDPVIFPTTATLTPNFPGMRPLDGTLITPSGFGSVVVDEAGDPILDTNGDPVPAVRSTVEVLDQHRVRVYVEALPVLSDLPEGSKGIGGVFLAWDDFFETPNSPETINFRELFSNIAISMKSETITDRLGNVYAPVQEVKWTVQDSQNYPNQGEIDGVVLAGITNALRQWQASVEDFANARTDIERITDTAFSVEVAAGQRLAYEITFGSEVEFIPIVIVSKSGREASYAKMVSRAPQPRRSEMREAVATAMAIRDQIRESETAAPQKIFENLLATTDASGLLALSREEMAALTENQEKELHVALKIWKNVKLVIHGPVTAESNETEQRIHRLMEHRNVIIELDSERVLAKYSKLGTAVEISQWGKRALGKADLLKNLKHVPLKEQIGNILLALHLTINNGRLPDALEKDGYVEDGDHLYAQVAEQMLLYQIVAYAA